jgi:hypothetical protein
MGYFTIRLDKDASKICIIIFSLGESILPKKIHGGYGRFSDVLQGILELMESLEHV